VAARKKKGEELEFGPGQVSGEEKKVLGGDCGPRGQRKKGERRERTIQQRTRRTRNLTIKTTPVSVPHCSREGKRKTTGWKEGNRHKGPSEGPRKKENRTQKKKKSFAITGGGGGARLLGVGSVVQKLRVESCFGGNKGKTKIEKRAAAREKTPDWESSN